MQPQLDRRRFLGFLLLSAALVRCKKDVIVAPKTTTSSSGFQPVSTPLSPSTLAEYTVTEAGPNLQTEPTFMSGFNGYCDKISYNPGASADLFFSGPANNAETLTLTDMKGNTVLSLNAALTTQTIKNDKPWAQGFNYQKTASVQLPGSLNSGVYVWNKTVPVIVKGSPGADYDLTVVYNNNTLHAYNWAGGKSLYQPDFANRATVISFLRSNTIANIGFFEWLGHQSYNVNYIADSDLDDYSLIQNSKALIITGHSEYWTREARASVDQFLASGKNVMMLSGNNMWWQVRYNQTKDVMICYKSTSGSNFDHNSLDPLAGTIYSTINYGANVDYDIMASMGTDYRWGGYGQTLANRWNGYKIVNENSPVLAGSGLKNGDIFTLPTTEYEGAPVVTLFAPGTDSIPEIDNSVLNFHKVELLGFDFAENLTRKDKLGFGLFMVCQKTPTTGTIFNCSSMDWCLNFSDKNSSYNTIRTITQNMIDLSLNGQTAFTK